MAGIVSIFIIGSEKNIKSQGAFQFTYIMDEFDAQCFTKIKKISNILLSGTSINEQVSFFLVGIL